MKTNPSTQFRSAFLALLVSAVPLTVTASQEALAAALEQARTDFVQTGNQLQATVKSLSDLAHQEKGDLKPAFDAFAANLDATEKSGKVAAERATAMGAAAKDYFATWQTDINAISNPELKARAVKRMTTAQKNYDQLTEAGRSVAEQFKPLLSDLRDIKATLASDLTPDGIKAIKSTANRASRRMESLHSETNDLLNVISDIRKSLSSSVGQ
jgi:Protein of unknown function (DUF2959)